MASYQPPNPQQGSIFNPSDWISPNAGSIDTAYLNDHYCQYPVAQGNMSFAGINNTGTTTIKQNLVMTGIANTNFIEFPDGTKQYTAGTGSSILNTSNTFIGTNTFNPTPSSSVGYTLPIGISLLNNQQGNNEGDIIYKGTSSTGLCIYSTSRSNVQGETPQILLYPDGTQTVLTAIAVGGIVRASALSSSGLIQLQATTGVNVGVDAGLPLLNIGGFGNISGDLNGLNVSSNLTLPAQSSYDSGIVYSNLSATQAFVQSALGSGGGGYAILSSPSLQTFTGPIQFAGETTALTQATGTMDTTLATTQFVYNAIISNMYTQNITTVVSDTTGFYISTADFNFVQTYNGNTGTNTYMFDGATLDSVAVSNPLIFTLTFPSALYPINSGATFVAGTVMQVYEQTTLTTFNLQITFLNNTQVKFTSGGTLMNTYGPIILSGALYISWAT
jgi:hypothetical protein